VDEPVLVPLAVVPDVPVDVDPVLLPEPIFAFVSMYAPLLMLLDPVVPDVPAVLEGEPVPLARQPVTVTSEPVLDDDDDVVGLCAPRATSDVDAMARTAACQT